MEHTQTPLSHCFFLQEKVVASVSTDSKQREVGYWGKQIFELNNHLGNVLATITDKKLQVSTNNSSTSYFEAEVQTVQDYYAFGMQMPGRKSSGGYRYGFGGHEKTTEVGEDSYTAEYWQYDARINRRWNIDPVVKDDESPYMTYGNNPVVMVDPSGADWYKNGKTGGIEYKAKWEGESKNSKYKYVGKGEGDILKYEGKEYNKKTGSVTNILDEVVVQSYKKGKKKADNNSGVNIFNWPNYSKADGERWDRYHAMVRDRHRAGQDLLQIGDPLEYTIGINTFERSWQAEQSWRSVNYAILDGATFFVPVPKLGMFRWLKYGGRTFQEAKAAIWAKNAKPIFQKIVNEETSQTFKVFAEIHHKYIPQRWGLPNWITNSRFNLQITNSIEHGLMDPYRFQFFPSWIKEGIKEGAISAENVIIIK